VYSKPSIVPLSGGRKKKSWLLPEYHLLFRILVRMAVTSGAVNTNIIVVVMGVIIANAVVVIVIIPSSLSYRRRRRHTVIVETLSSTTFFFSTLSSWGPCFKENPIGFEALQQKGMLVSFCGTYVGIGLKTNHFCRLWTVQMHVSYQEKQSLLWCRELKWWLSSRKWWYGDPWYAVRI